MKPTEHSFSDTDLSAWCSRFDHHDPALTHDNVYQVYDHLRQECPVSWSDSYGGFWVVSRHADIVTVLMDSMTFSSAEGVHLPRQAGQQKPIPINYDPPLHTQYRKIFNDALNLHLIRGREPVIRSVIVHLLAPLASKRGGELVSELAIQLPIHVISGMLGLKEHTTSRIRIITEHVWMTFGKERDPAPLRELLVLLMDEVNERRAHPQNDLITQFVTLTIEGRFLTDEELLSMLIAFVVAGHETTMNAIGNLLLYLAEQPQEQVRLRQDPERIPWAIEESLRYDNPTHLFARTVTRETMLNGSTMKKGDTVVLFYASGNRDTDQFEL